MIPFRLRRFFYKLGIRRGVLILAVIGMVLLLHVSNHGNRPMLDKTNVKNDIIAIRKSTFGPEQKVLTFKQKWELNKKLCSGLESHIGSEDFPLQYINVSDGYLQLYTLNKERDGIAITINRNKSFEPYIDKIIHHYLVKDTDVNFIDIGANIGVRSLQVAHLGRRCLAIEALDENIMRLCASVKHLNLQDKMIIVHNAISDVHAQLKIALSSWGGRGGTYIDDPQVKKMKEKEEYMLGQYNQTKLISSVMLDDLLDLPGFKTQFKKVFIKLDIEGFEHKAIAGGAKFFRDINVVGMVMEWRWHKGQPSADEIISNLRQWNFVPYEPQTENLIRLNWENHVNWPEDVIWLPRGSFWSLF